MAHSVGRLAELDTVYDIESQLLEVAGPHGNFPEFGLQRSDFGQVVFDLG